MRNTMKLRSGATIPQITREEADKKNYLTRAVLTQMHLMPSGDPAAFDKAEDGSLIYYFEKIEEEGYPFESKQLSHVVK